MDNIPTPASSNDDTVPRTLWTATLLEMLVVAVKREQDRQARRILRDIRAHGIRKTAVLEHAGKHLDAAGTAYLNRLIGTLGRQRHDTP